MTVPDYEIILAGRMGPLVASCLPGLRSQVPPATVLSVSVTDQATVLQLLSMLTEHRLTLLDVRIDPAPAGATQTGTDAGHPAS